MKLLLLGEKSFAANGLYELLTKEGLETDCFSRGYESRNGDFVTGDVFKLSENKELLNEYDIVINFIIIKNESVNKNIGYIEELDKFCKSRKVKKLIQISSVSCYPWEASSVNETTDIENNHLKKGSYASIKVAVDRFLISLEKPYKVSFIRPGFIYTPDGGSGISGIGIHLFSKVALILGNKKTPLAKIRRERLHQGILKILNTGCSKSVYLMFENNNSTKKDFLAGKGYKITIPLNRFLVTGVSKIAVKTGFFNSSQLEQVRSLFRHTNYECYNTEFELGYSFIKNSFCIIGAGTYGSYIADIIKNTYTESYITVFEAGEKKIKTESQIGYKTNILKDPYIGTSEGRYFGFGGSSAKWGGQLLTFSSNDFKNPSGLLKDIVKIDEKYRDKVFNKFNIRTEFEEKHIGNGLYIKTGFWLGYFRRNLFKYFRINKMKNLKIISNTRVLKILHSGKKITGLEYNQNGKKCYATFNRYFLCCGAFESFRILLESKLIPKKHVSFSDHLSTKMFLVKGPAKIGENDFTFRVKGTSLITKRIIGEIENVSFYVNPKFNANFPFFQNLKALLFKREWSLSLVKSVILDLPSFIAFGWSILVNKKIYIYKNEWEIDIDIENPTLNSNITLSDTLDAYGQRGLDLKFVTDKKVSDLYNRIRIIVKDILDRHNIDYEELNDTIHVTKCEDTYHPYGMLNGFGSLNEYLNWFENMLVVNTGILPRAGGINTAAAVFPVIEEYFSRYSNE